MPCGKFVSATTAKAEAFLTLSSAAHPARTCAPSDGVDMKESSEPPGSEKAKLTEPEAGCGSCDAAVDADSEREAEPAAVPDAAWDGANELEGVDEDKGEAEDVGELEAAPETDGIALGVTLGVALGVGLGVGLGVALVVALGVTLGVALGVCVPDGEVVVVGVAEMGDDDGVVEVPLDGETLRVVVGVRVEVAVPVGVGEAVAVGDGVPDGVDVGVSEGVCDADGGIVTEIVAE